MQVLLKEGVYLDLNINMWTDHQFAHGKTSSTEITADSLFCWVFSCEWNFLVDEPVADSNWAPLMLPVHGDGGNCFHSTLATWGSLLMGELVKFLIVCLQHHKTQTGQNTAQNKAFLWQDLYFLDLACELLPFLPSWQTAIIIQMTYIGRPRIINN